MTASILAGRVAHCDRCRQNERPSDGSLAFFEYRGEGSHRATETCKHCRYFKVAHKPEGNSIRGRSPLVCGNFEPIGAHDFDVYYCGCGGWD